jgi:RNA polymerase sigma-54 factor
LFVKCLQQRNNTMRRMMQILVAHQREFILSGDRHLTPMTRARLAEEIGVHESTVSRAVANKGIALPDGRIIPLARFFDRSLSVRDRIKEIVRQEPKPLTDEQIASILERQGVNIARRTVAKYRAIEGILPARLRKSHGATA